ncbi:hypothetical protein V1290_002518 [Bradyrhizobium sp. AZCC 1578]|uniref:Uncharacterized protein n=1 Tax=Bradyrhizobium algeriense TaxID=634784 RepID=A0ABU8BNT0_9BRAD
MPIYRLLQNVPLGPDEVKRLADAYEHTLSVLSVKDRNDPLAEFIAKKIIEIGQTGLKDPAQISARAIEELGLP